MTQRDDLWPVLIERICEIARAKLKNNMDGVATIRIDMAVNRWGEPLIWLEPTCRRIEPSSDAARVLLQHFVED